MQENMQTVLELCPENIRAAVLQEAGREGFSLEEIHIRAGAPVSVVSSGREWILAENGRPITATAAMAAQMLKEATQHSLYAAQEQLRCGYFTLPGGHRFGVCGSAVIKNGEISTLKEISSLNLRIARQPDGVADEVACQLWSHPESTLIIGAPGSGKTTVLRDLIRQMSDRFRYRVAVVDERGELAACLDGTPQFRLGKRTDVLTGSSKEQGIVLLLRSMNPEWIALDELSAAQDVDSVAQASYCGVRFVATAHAWSREDLSSRPVYKRLLQTGVFRNLAVIGKNRQLSCERL